MRLRVETHNTGDSQYKKSHVPLKKAGEKLPPKKAIYPLECPRDIGLRSQLMSLVPLDNQGPLNTLRVEERKHLKPLLAKLNADDSSIIQITNELKSEFQELGQNLENVLAKEFRLSSEDTKKIILQMLLILEGGYSNFIGKILEQGSKGFNYELCIEFLKSLSEPDLEVFLYNATLDNHKRVDNLGKSLLELADENYVLRVLKRSIRENPDLNKKKKESREKKEDKQLILLACMRFKKDLGLNEVLEQFNYAVSMEVAYISLELLRTRFKEKAHEVLNYIANDLDGNNVLRGLAICKLAELPGQDKVQTVSKITENTTDPFIASMGCAALINFCGEKGKSSVINLIQKEIQGEKPLLLLATLAWSTECNSAYCDALKRVLSTEENLIDSFSRIHESKLRVLDCVDRWLDYDTMRAHLSQIVLKIGLEEKYIPWMIHGKSEVLRRNLRDLLYLALSKESSNLLQTRLTEFLGGNGERSKEFIRWLKEFEVVT
ncbi:MAG: hypothetical protein HYY52_01770 [Candidatus Melainabacteria bacterium]|nr:hypothetical protein [Candidatus Melainabacteria bacterium]